MQVSRTPPDSQSKQPCTTFLKALTEQTSVESKFRGAAKRLTRVLNQKRHICLEVLGRESFPHVSQTF